MVKTRGGGSIIEDDLVFHGEAAQISLNLVKQGFGTFTLGGDNTYTGTTNVAQGELKVLSTNAMGRGGGTATTARQ